MKSSGEQEERITQNELLCFQCLFKVGISPVMDYIVVGLRSRIVSYVLDDRTGRLVSGDMNREKFMEYELELSRKTGTVTNPEGDDIKTETCPHCGAPLNLNASAQCEYCGSVITRVNTNWAVSSMKGISQRTA